MMQLTVEGKSPDEIADNLDTIAGMLRQGYQSGIGSPCNWDLSGESEEEEEEEEEEKNWGEEKPCPNATICFDCCPCDKCGADYKKCKENCPDCQECRSEHDVNTPD